MRQKGFTLIELLVVIGIIALMAGALGVALRDSGGSASLGSAQRTLGGLFQSARSLAVLKQTHTAVLIYKGPDVDRALRYAEVVFYNKDRVNAGGTPDPRWETSGQGTFLPQGNFFVPPDTPDILDGSPNAYSSSSWRSTNDTVTSAQLGGISTAKSTVVPASNAEWYAYYFDPSGFSKNPGNRVLIGLGRFASPEKLAFDNGNVGRGFDIRRLGSVTYFNDIN